MKELQRQANQDIVIALVGNKLDLVEDDESERQVLLDDAKAYADEADLLFFETSAKSALNVDAVFAAIGNFHLTSTYSFTHSFSFYAAEKIPLESIMSGRNAGGRPSGSSRVELTHPASQTTGSCAC